MCKTNLLEWEPRKGRSEAAIDHVKMYIIMMEKVVMQIRSWDKYCSTFQWLFRCKIGIFQISLTQCIFSKEHTAENEQWQVWSYFISLHAITSHLYTKFHMPVSVLSEIIYSASQWPHGVARTVSSLLLGKWRCRHVDWLASMKQSQKKKALSPWSLELLITSFCSLHSTIWNVDSVHSWIFH